VAAAAGGSTDEWGAFVPAPATAPATSSGGRVHVSAAGDAAAASAARGGDGDAWGDFAAANGAPSASVDSDAAAVSHADANAFAQPSAQAATAASDWNDFAPAPTAATAAAAGTLSNSAHRLASSPPHPTAHNEAHSSDDGGEWGGFNAATAASAPLPADLFSEQRWPDADVEAGDSAPCRCASGSESTAQLDAESEQGAEVRDSKPSRDADELGLAALGPGIGTGEQPQTARQGAEAGFTQRAEEAAAAKLQVRSDSLRELQAEADVQTEFGEFEHSPEPAARQQGMNGSLPDSVATVSDAVGASAAISSAEHEAMPNSRADHVTPSTPDVCADGSEWGEFRASAAMPLPADLFCEPEKVIAATQGDAANAAAAPEATGYEAVVLRAELDAAADSAGPAAAAVATAGEAAPVATESESAPVAIDL
jgi:hypothetical protein